MKNSLIQKLKEKNLISQITNEQELNTKLQKNIVVYCGFDPTADSLHLGHLIPLICLKIFQEQGHKPIVLLGGATGMVGDPSFKLFERNFNSLETIKIWSDKIEKQISKFLDFNCGDNSAKIVNNYDWFCKINILIFLRDIGKYFSINQMINKEAIKTRFNRANKKGLSFTELSYNLLQSYDFYYLNKYHNVILQIGGSDQWGNITSGIHLTKCLENKKVYGLTVPLILNKDGNKFGKSENQTIWLDSKKTSPYKFYQFWLNIEDNKIYLFLKLFTYINIQDFLKKENIKSQLQDNPRKYQYLLAEKITYFVHGNDGLCSAKRITKSLFLNKIDDLKEIDFKQLSLDGILKIYLTGKDDLQQALVLSKLAPSRSQAKNMIFANAISINGNKNNNIYYFFTDKDKIFGKFTLLCRGRKNFCLIEWNKNFL